MAYIEEVFKDSGIPTLTFVQPNEYTKIIVALRAPGKCLIVEGPSGIGKTTCIIKGLEFLHKKRNSYRLLTPRKPDNLSIIESILTDNKDKGLIIIDDFHLLSPQLKSKLSDLMKTIADEDREDIKLVLIGINKAGDSLINLSPDLNNRITTVKFEVNPDSKIQELIEKGEDALKIKIKYKENIVRKANGSFHITQLLCKELCLNEGVIETQNETKELNTDINYIVDKIMNEMQRVFYKVAIDFSVGSRLRRGGRAPYLHLLYWLSQSKDWSIKIDEMYRIHPTHKSSISQVADKGYLTKLINENERIRNVINYDETSKILTVEDPKFIFYIQNIDWSNFSNKLGLKISDFEKDYDFALSFAGEIRTIVQKLANELSSEYECSVFYDYNEQHKILGKDLKDYFDPIYSSNAEFVVVFLDSNYPKKLWTNFESEKFKNRFGEHAIIPIIFKGNEPSQFDQLHYIGSLLFDPAKDIDSQIKEFANLLHKKLEEKRS